VFKYKPCLAAANLKGVLSLPVISEMALKSLLGRIGRLFTAIKRAALAKFLV